MSLVRDQAKVVTYYYLLEPGDGTRYQFNLTSCYGLEKVIPGVSKEHVLVGFKNYPSFVIKENEILEPQKHMVSYARGQTNAPAYTIAAVLLAASILLINPENLDEACVRMRRARELLS
jgi:hypothetical protein